MRRLTAEEMVTVAICCNDPSRIGADQRSDPAGGAADHRHGDGVDRVFEPEGGRGLEIADVIGKRRSGHAHERAGERGGDELEAQRRHAGGFGRELVVADGGEAVAELRALDAARDGQRDDHQREHQQEQILDVGADERDFVRADDVGAARAADVVPVDDERLQHDGERERRDGEECAAQPQREIAHAEPDDARHDAADHDQERDRQRVELVQEHRRIGADREERRRAEIHVAGVAAEDVPGGRQHDELQHGVAGEEHVVVVHRARAEEHDGRHRDRDQQEDPSPHDRQSYRPSRPAGRNARVSRRTPNDTAGAQDGP